ncbi:MAG: hypothetical protein R3F56_10800 [Planctomycetota bacterium]
MRHGGVAAARRASTAIGAAVVVAALAACSAVTTIFADAAPRTAPYPVPGTDLFDWKGVVHCHSYLSHDCDGTVEEILDACRVAGIDFVVMTDHQTDASVRDGLRGRRQRTLFVVGAEIRTPQGTIIAFPLRKPLRRWQSAGALVAEARRQGAISFLCHAERTKAWDTPGIAGVEIVNLHAGAVSANRAGMLAAGLFLPLRALFQQICRRDDEVFHQWDAQLAQRHPMTPVGGNDAHASVRIFGPLGGTIGNYREVFLTLSTHVLAPSMDEEQLIAAFRAGRSYTSFDLFGDGTGFDFRAVDGNGVHLPGGTVTTAAELELRVGTPAVGVIRLLRDGEAVQETTGKDLAHRAPAPGVYRVEVRTRGGAPWLFSSSIRVVAPAT